MVQSGNDTNTVIENIEDFTTDLGNYIENYPEHKFQELVRQMNDSFSNNSNTSKHYSNLRTRDANAAKPADTLHRRD